MDGKLTNEAKRAEIDHRIGKLTEFTESFMRDADRLGKAHASYHQSLWTLLATLQAAADEGRRINDEQRAAGLPETPFADPTPMAKAIFRAAFDEEATQEVATISEWTVVKAFD